jgi:hypothetical protein
MRSLLGRFHRPFARGVDEQLLLLNNLGDGSTLSLDFTTGVLDPRLTFTRTTNATFINSQGLVQYADANMFINSAWTDANNVPQGWTLSTATGSISRLNETRTITCTAQQYWFFQQPATAIGLVYSVSFEITAISGTIILADVILVGSSSGAEYFIDGVSKGTTGPGTGQNAPATTGRVTVVFTATAVNPIIRLGLGTAGTNVTGSVTIRYPQFQPGAVPLPTYYENTSTSAARFNSARFDYDPTTLQPRGLLIEGSASNLATYSNLQAAWAGGVNTSVTTNTTEVLSPDGTNNAAKVALTNAGYCSRFEAISNLAASTAYTFSYWIRGTAGNQQRVYSVTAAADLVTQTTLSYSTSGWTRVQITFTTTAALTTAYIYVVSRPTGTVSDVVYIWGVQLEAGTGASSLIPTGASTGSRAFDSCVMTGTNFSSWFSGATEGVLYAECERPRKIESTATDHAIVGTRYASGQGLWVYASATNQFPSSYIFPSGGAQFAGGIATMIPLVSKQAVRWFNANDITNFGNGTQGTTNTAGTGTMVPTMLTIGANSTSGTAAVLEWFNGCIRRVKFWPIALPESQIIAITT